MQELLKHFHELSLHPKNAKKLKGLILQLGIQGKLTVDWRSQNPELITGENSTENLLKKINEKKIKLVKGNKIKKEKPLGPIKDTEISYKLPEVWQWQRLREVGITQTGSTPPKKNPDYYGDYIPFVGPAHISNSKIEYPSDGLSEKGLEKGRLIPKYSLMMVCIGGSIGKCYVNSIDVSCNQQINAVTTIKSPIKFIQFVCQSEYFQRKVFLKSSGSATPIINKGKWETIPIPFPPLEEQKVIVETIEILFKEVEALENLTEKRIKLKKNYATSALIQLAKNNSKAEWQALKPQFHTFFNEIDNIKKLRETILQLAVQGKLTAKWRAQNPDLVSGENSAENLLKEIKAEKDQLINDKVFQKPRQKGDIKNGEFEYDIPKTWTNAKIVDLAFVTKLAGFEYTKYINLADKGEVPVIRAQNVKMNRIDETKLKYIDLETSEQLYRCALVKPSVLMTFIGAGIGDVAIFNKKERWHLAPNVAKLEPFNSNREKVNIYYLLFYLMSPIGQLQIFKHSKATAQPSLSMGTIRDSIVLLPSFEEQTIIVQKVNSLMNLCDQLEKKVESGQQQIEDLMQSVLKEVFEGEKEMESTSVL